MSLTPPLFHSAAADGTDTTLFRPSDWNRVSDLLTTLLGGADATGSLFVKNSGGDGAGWLAPGAAGTVVVGTGATPAFSATPTLTSLTLSTPLGIASGGTGLSVFAVGDIPYASGTTTLAKLAGVAAGSVMVSGTAPAWSATPTLTSLTLGSYVLGAGPFVQASGHRWLHSEAGGGGGSVFENTCGGYDAGASLVGNCYANAIWGKNAGRLLNGTAPQGCSNAIFGYGAGEFATTSSFLTLFGTASGGSITTVDGVTYLGYHCGNRSRGSGNTGTGQFALRGAASIATGTSNTATGDSSMTAFTTATSCAAHGISTLENCTSGSQHTAMGSFSLRATTTNSGCIGLGYFSGAFETGSNKFFVNNVSRVNEAGDRTLSIIYGVMAALAKNQLLTFNVGATKIATPDTFANLPAAPAEGMLASVTDSNTATWRATIAGGGTNHVLAYYNGTNWTVAG
jgi:hypothetical protein